MIVKKERGSYLFDENNVVGVDYVVERQEYIGICVGSFFRCSLFFVVVDYFFVGFDKFICMDGVVSIWSRYVFYVCNQLNGIWGVSQFLLCSGMENEKMRGVVILFGEKLCVCFCQVLVWMVVLLEVQWLYGEILMVFFC